MSHVGSVIWNEILVALVAMMKICIKRFIMLDLWSVLPTDETSTVSAYISCML